MSQSVQRRFDRGHQEGQRNGALRRLRLAAPLRKSSNSAITGNAPGAGPIRGFVRGEGRLSSAWAHTHSLRQLPLEGVDFGTDILGQAGALRQGLDVGSCFAGAIEGRKQFGEHETSRDEFGVGG
jgi:hypothetical protein